MTTQVMPDDEIEAIALLDEPNRRRLYQMVVASPEPIGRDDAAATLAISRELAAFHLDRLVGAGLLATEYRRRSGRSGPGAGRPAKLYRRSNREVALALPPRHYLLAADLMATALDRLPAASGAALAADVARERGRADGAQARREVGLRPSRRRLWERLFGLLHVAGYEPVLDAATGTLTLRNCPYHALAEEHRELTCGMNLAWAEGVLEELRPDVSAELEPAAGRCCVLFHPDSGRDAGRATSHLSRGRGGSRTGA
jgi:predicted ArsR family transcriptional regulator